MLHQLLKPLLIILITALIAGIIRLLWLRKEKTASFSFSHELLLLAFVIYTLLVLCITLFPVPMTLTETPANGKINIIPFFNSWKEIKESNLPGRGNMPVHPMMNIAGNIILFIPLGLLLPKLTSYTSFAEVVILAIIVSMGIEILQFILREFNVYRAVDIDDLLLNVLGAIIGFVAFRLLFYKPIPIDAD